MLKELNGGKTPSFSTTSIVDEEPFQFTAYMIIPESDYDEVLSRAKEHNK